LFRHYFFPLPVTRDVSGGVSFVLRDPEKHILVKGMKTGMVPQVVLGALIIVEPEQVNWKALGEKNDEFTPVFGEVKDLRALGLIGRQVTTHFHKHCLAPLQHRLPQPRSSSMCTTADACPLEGTRFPPQWNSTGM
jgi:hypothetical protein